MTGQPALTREQFWDLVQQTLREAQALPDPRRGLLRRRVALRPGQRHVEALLRRLAVLSDAGLTDVQEHLDALRADLLDAGIRGAARVALGGADEDDVTDLCTWLVSQGAAAYDRVRADPDALADIAPPDLRERLRDAELWGYVALEVWDGRHDDDMPRPGVRAPRDPDGAPPDDDPEEAARSYPRLWARRTSP